MNKLIFVMFLYLVTLFSCGEKRTKLMKDNEFYVIWGAMGEYMDGENWVYPAPQLQNHDIISALPRSMKASIAFYSRYISPEIFFGDRGFAELLGDYGSLAATQDSLLKEYPSFVSSYPVIYELLLFKSGNSYLFWQGNEIDIFELDDNGNILSSRHVINNMTGNTVEIAKHLIFMPPEK